MTLHCRTPDSTPAARLNAQARREGWPTVCDDTLAFDSDRLKALLGVWNAVRGDRALPLRGDFSARALVRHLRDIAFIDCVRPQDAPRRFRFGFYGSGLARYTGDCTGKFLDEVVAPQFIGGWNASYDTVLEMAAPLRFVAQFRAFNLDYMSAESLVAPIGDIAGTACGLLVSVVYSPRVAA